MKIAIVGSGAVGCYYGARLLQAGNEIRFLMRSDLETVRRDGLKISSPDGDACLRDVPAFGSTAEIGEVHLVIVALKTTANAALSALLPLLLGKKTLILTLQNGLGNEAFLAAHFGVERVLSGLAFVCLTRTAPGIIEHYGHGGIALGEASGPSTARTRQLAETFNNANIACRLAEDMPWERWRKLLWNIPFNGLAIAAQATVADILADPLLTSEILALMHEVIAAAKVLGHKIPTTIPQQEIERSRNMGPYRPSSYVDFQRGLPVEVEAIWGEPLRQAQAAGATLPRMEMLYALLRRVTQLPPASNQP